MRNWLRRLKFAFPILALASVLGFAALAGPLTLGEGTNLNMSRPCSYRGKVSTNLSVTAASAATGTALTAGSVVRIVCTQAIHWRTARTSPTAVGTDTLLPANTIEWIISEGPEGDFFAAIRDSADGTCYLTVCR